MHDNALFEFFIVINVWTDEESKNKIRNRRISQTPPTNSSSSSDINTQSNASNLNKMPVMQKFGNGKVVTKASSLGHEGKYTQSTSVPNLANRVSNPTQSTQNIDKMSMINRNTIPNQNINSFENEFLYQRLSSQSDIATSNKNLTNTNNTHGNYVDIDALDRIRSQTDNYNSQYPLSYNTTSSPTQFDRNYSFNQNHQQTSIDNQKLNALRYSTCNLAGRESYASQASQMQHGHYKLSPSSSGNVAGGRSPSPLGNLKSHSSENSPIYENQPSQIRRSESPIYSNTNTNMSNFHQDSVGPNQNKQSSNDLHNLYQKYVTFQLCNYVYSVVM